MLTPAGYVRPRCKRRDCGRCWALRSRETARCLVLDANEEMPTICMTLTTHDPDTSPAVYREGSLAVFRRLRRRYGRVEYFGAVEFTTGRKARDRRRRLHGHYLVKGLPVEDAGAIAGLVRETWKRTVGAWVIDVAPLRSPGAALGYLGLHHRKPSQLPPRAWQGKTERPSQGYWHRPIAELRAEARAQLAAEALAWRTGMPAELARLEVAAREPGRLVRVRQLGDAAVLEPLGPFEPVRRVEA